MYSCGTPQSQAWVPRDRCRASSWSIEKQRLDLRNGNRRMDKESHTEWQAVRRPAPSCSDCAAGQRVEAQVRLLSASFDEVANSRTLLCAGSICSQTSPQEPKVTILRSDILWKSPPFVITLAGSKSIAYRGACHGMTAWPAPAARSRSTMRTCCASTDTITGWAAILISHAHSILNFTARPQLCFLLPAMSTLCLTQELYSKLNYPQSYLTELNRVKQEQTGYLGTDCNAASMLPFSTSSCLHAAQSDSWPEDCSQVHALAAAVPVPSGRLRMPGVAGDAVPVLHRSALPGDARGEELRPDTQLHGENACLLCLPVYGGILVNSFMSPELYRLSCIAPPG